jgi:flagellar M-ring protein FliF
MAADSATLSKGLANSLADTPANGPGNMGGLPASLRPLLILIGIAAAVAAGVWIVLWSRGPTYSLLYANLSPQDEAQVAQALDGAQIPYKLDAGSNGIEVPVERLDEARLKLAGQGVTDSDSFAALEKSSGFGVSQFMEDVRYQHALEMELARTIASMQPIAGARVNLAEPRQSVFVSDNRTASASVFVQLKPGSTLDPEQVQAIINLVASSVPNLSPGEVTVVDQQGNLLSAPNGHDPYATDERAYDMVHRMETDYARRIEALLTPLVGPGLVHAQVVAELNLGSREQAKELYTPNSQIVRSEHLSQQSAGGPATGGVPGSLSNEPPTPGVAVPLAAAQPAAKAGQSGAAAAGGTQSAAASGAAGASAAATPAAAARQPATEPVGGTVGALGGNTVSSDVTRNYEIDRTLDYSNQPPGTVRRLTVAVLIGDRSVTGPDGKVKTEPLSAQELARVTQLVKDAVGFDASRGDSVSVVNATLETASTPAAGPAGFQAAPLWQSPFVWGLLRIVAGLVVVLVLVLSVLKPLVRTLIAPMRLPSAAAAGAQALPGAPAGAAAAALPPGQKDPVVSALTHEQQLAQARTLVGQDPKRVAQVVRGWVGADE